MFIFEFMLEGTIWNNFTRYLYLDNTNVFKKDYQTAGANFEQVWFDSVVIPPILNV